MEHQKSIIEALTSAISHLEKSMKALVNKDENRVMTSVWKSAADLEYANFLFSITRDKLKSSSWKLDLRSKQVEIGPLLVSAQDLIKEAKNDLDADGLLEAYKKTWMARGYLLKVSDIFQKAQKSQGIKRET
jgi:hypothetical protein